MNFAQGIFLVSLAFALGAAAGWFVRDRTSNSRPSEGRAGWPTEKRSGSGRSRSSRKSSSTDTSASSVSLAAAGAAAAAKMDSSGDWGGEWAGDLAGDLAGDWVEATTEPDDLTRIKGIGPKLNERCQSFSICRFDQIATWSEADIARFDQSLNLSGRITRDRWVEQAKLLAAGDDAALKAEFG